MEIVCMNEYRLVYIVKRYAEVRSCAERVKDSKGEIDMKTGDNIPRKYGIARYDEKTEIYRVVILFECDRNTATDSLWLSVHFARFPFWHNGNNTERFGI